MKDLRLLVAGLFTVSILAFYMSAQLQADDVGPANYEHRATGALVTFIAGSGTNSTMQFENTSAFPWRIYDAVATTNGVAVPYTVSRIWNWQRTYKAAEVITNFQGVVETNWGSRVVSDWQTNLVYNSTNDLPSTSVFIRGDIVHVDFDSETNALFRLVGSNP
jgi:hypothetical protein